MEGDVTAAKSNLLEQLEALGSPQVPHNTQHVSVSVSSLRLGEV